MGLFTNMASYSSGNLPRVGTCTSYTVCDSISSYMPYDVSPVLDLIENSFNNILEQIDADIERMNEVFVQIDEEWGEKYICINQAPLNISDYQTFHSYTDNYSSKIEMNRNDCLEIVNKVIDTTERIIEYIQQIENNNETYQTLKEEAAELALANIQLQNQIDSITCVPNYDPNSIVNLQVQINSNTSLLDSKKVEIERYELSRIPEPDGAWIVA